MPKQKIKTKAKSASSVSSKKSKRGFTLIELLVVVAIIALLSAIALVALQSSRQKSRDAKRLADMTQIATAMELYFNTNKGYPTEPVGLIPNFARSLISNPLPADGQCPALTYPYGGGIADDYYYYPSPTGGSYVIDGLEVYPDYLYFFCLGHQTGSFPEGIHWVSPKGVR